MKVTCLTDWIEMAKACVSPHHLLGHLAFCSICLGHCGGSTGRCVERLMGASRVPRGWPKA